MNKKDCDVLLTLNRVRNITKAAEQLYITQPALTYRLKQLEDTFNCKLFIRERSGLRPTFQGEVVIAFAERLLKEINATFEELEMMDTEVKGTIKLGVASTYGQYILPNILHTFQNLYPDATFHIVTGFSSRMMELFEAGDVHIAIVRGIDYWDEEKALLAQEPICIVQKDPISIPDLVHLPQIRYEMDTFLEGLVDDWWKNVFATARMTSMSVDSLETAKEMARVGMGYALLPGICLIEEKDLYIEQLHTKEGVPVTRNTWAYCHHNTMEFAAVRAFYNFLVQNKEYSATTFTSK